jgi:uncharacterized membrane protein YjfL (UPF0719 family)
MSSAITLLEAIAVSSILMFIIAFYRSVTRGPKPPSFLNNHAVAFGSALLMTVAVTASSAFEAYSVMPFVHSAFWSVVIAIAIQVVAWSVARSIIPLKNEDVA